MPDRVAHDHPTVETLDGTLARYGATHRSEIRLPSNDAIPVDEVLRVVLDGVEYRAEIAARSNGDPVIRGAYETPRQARNPGAATDHLDPWVEDRDLAFGRTVHVDVVDAGHKVGLRAPGESATYTVVEPPKDSLAAIAKDLEED
ncbi:Uncharacterized protein HSRCO_1387 [Halanaeroarchaeum sp. HSR-CO]|uniref:DUF7112 family protein n=1 Tax=Halanaeroarchaeum sp. HSR-CO TaxID=2866382 RepID=UPI00217DC95D|nr:hypothetical protein [Halanaeroarchaeum sp. HSR-CO]UWG47670.1 Uncharacterized protein HSRCO_1387 [Halanaeroarchaeum sp. HSR-CO]